MTSILENLLCSPFLQKLDDSVKSMMKTIILCGNNSDGNSRVNNSLAGIILFNPHGVLLRMVLF